jgi:hypothetical protein
MESEFSESYLGILYCPLENVFFARLNIHYFTPILLVMMRAY